VFSREKEMKTMIYRHYGGIICMVLSLSSGGGVKAASTSNINSLTKALSDYCVPKCTSGCVGIFLADYVMKDPQDLSKGGDCVCPADMNYDSALRECLISCPAGSYLYAGAGNCPEGYQLETRSNCASGTYQLAKTDDHGAVIAANGTCPAGSGEINIIK
jgi:hypothetical protein